jgi:hypothetical protein
MAEQSREEESEINAPQNILTQDAGWRTGQSETTLRRPTPIQLSGGRYPRSQMPLVSGGFSSIECFAHSIPTNIVFLDPAAQLTDDLLETNCHLCCHDVVNPLQVYFFSYILPYSSLASPNFLIEEAVLGRSLAYKKM